MSAEAALLTNQFCGFLVSFWACMRGTGAWHGENLSREQGGRHCIVVVEVRLETEKIGRMKNRVQADLPNLSLRWRSGHCYGCLNLMAVRSTVKQEDRAMAGLGEVVALSFIPRKELL